MTVSPRGACAIGLATALFGILGACAGSRTPRPVPVAESGSQVLLRFEASDGRSTVSGRLTLRTWDGERFELDLRDPLGRRRWTLRRNGATGWLHDADHQRYCRLDDERSGIPLPGWGDLPWRQAARVLLGESPVEALRPGRRGAVTHHGRWTFVWDGEQLRQWALWQGDEARLWWQVAPNGGVLSAADGSVLRWRWRAREALSAPWRPLEPPAGAEEVACAAFALP